MSSAYRGKSPITDPLLIPTPSRSSVSIRDIKNVYIYMNCNLMINMNKYFVFKYIQFYNCYLIKCNILFLLFKYLNNNFFKSL